MCAVRENQLSFRHQKWDALKPNDAVFLVLITGLFSTPLLPLPNDLPCHLPRILIPSLPVRNPDGYMDLHCSPNLSLFSKIKGGEKKKSKPMNEFYMISSFREKI